MKIVIFGLSISSSWGNGHATLWRGLCRAFQQRGHTVVFFEKDVSYYAANRDLTGIEICDLRLYSDWSDVRSTAEREAKEADIAIVTSYCPDGRAACDLVLNSCADAKIFYDLDTPVTLSRLDRGETVDYLPEDGLGRFDLVLSYTGGAALDALKSRLGAREALPLYGSVDPQVHRPANANPDFAAALSYLGTYADDRQAALERLFLQPAAQRPDLQFTIGGAQYPSSFPWLPNISFVRHLPPDLHPAFYCSSPFTLNITRGPMAAMGYCPSARLFEAAACGVPVLSDNWEGLENFYRDGQQILICRTPDDVTDALRLPPSEVERLGRAARERTLDEHTATHRAIEFESLLEGAHQHVGHRSSRR